MLFRRTNLARVINTVDKSKPSYFFYSIIKKQLMFCESRLELCGNKIFDLDERCADMQTQPYTFEYMWNGKLHKYTPDLLNKTTSNLLGLNEYKPKSKLEPYINKKGERIDPMEQYRVINAYVKGQGIDYFQVITDEQVFQEPRLFNTECLHYHAVGRKPKQMVIDTIKSFLASGSRTVLEVFEHLDPLNIDRNALWYLVGNHYVHLNRCQSIDLNTLLTWSQKDAI